MASGGSSSISGVSKKPRCDRHDANAEARELAGGRQDQRDDPALGSRIGGLAELTFVGRDGCGRDEHAALFAGRLVLRHRVRGQPQHVKRAAQVDADDVVEGRLRHRTVTSDDAAGRADAGAVHDDAQRSMRGRRVRDRIAHGSFIGDVARYRDAADFFRERGGGRTITVEQRNARAVGGQCTCACGAESGGATGNDGGAILDVHQPIAITAG